ncbi:hypothetical protein OPV22_023415 [Ensete ventricosum]|uniref:Uncharacterized protein n=1 Tax=Ensete ventricosum TaxID=4639 RepID=A0AAV8QQK6_ENSVE|nr:hypothetical protein OPV22_023415 [Ensete ventricosum]
METRFSQDTRAIREHVPDQVQALSLYRCDGLQISRLTDHRRVIPHLTLGGQTKSLQEDNTHIETNGRLVM